MWYMRTINFDESCCQLSLTFPTTNILNSTYLFRLFYTSIVWMLYEIPNFLFPLCIMYEMQHLMNITKTFNTKIQKGSYYQQSSPLEAYQLASSLIIPKIVNSKLFVSSASEKGILKNSKMNAFSKYNQNTF